MAGVRVPYRPASLAVGLRPTYQKQLFRSVSLTNCIIDSLLGILDGLVHRQNEASGLCGGVQCVDLDERRLPDALLHVVGHVFVQNVNAGPLLSCKDSCQCNGVGNMIEDDTLGVLLPQFVQDVRGVEAGVVAQLTRYDFKSAGDGADQHLFFAGNGTRDFPQVFGELHLNSTAT